MRSRIGAAGIDAQPGAQRRLGLRGVRQLRVAVSQQEIKILAAFGIGANRRVERRDGFLTLARLSLGHGHGERRLRLSGHAGQSQQTDEREERQRGSSVYSGSLTRSI